MSAVWINYFVRVQPLLADGTISREASFGLFVGAVVVLNDVSSVLIASLLLLALVLSQCVEYALALIYYRRGW